MVKWIGTLPQYMKALQLKAMDGKMNNDGHAI
jgi:hypothetical protein